MLTGRIAYTNPTYGFALITPAGKSRDYDVFCLERWFLAGGVGEPGLPPLAPAPLPARREREIHYSAAAAFGGARCFRMALRTNSAVSGLPS